ncbi:beta-ribofuranosylaminobenzene 5'-phosphate synthase [Methanoculleus taiwanensis]|uniref:Beta-ribofuranosylaminobenzene 5'-phosphate synthase n=1 Tax=Methanoculleus taiwanensis TaxID=1550565 RepID=A0A498GZR7_9EURY|nr:beta-ribofuranosylaminobenzene 5'-phosphate synthase [Methanoculleus taiwanensis]RXE55858.1 beta-ribofuranosylaminobenzene 5'-phosphate synthase [Methanoculleus taiwanensis]
MKAPAPIDISEKIQRIEDEIGHLAPLQKVLLGTDGSVTSLLEMATGHPVEIVTLIQEVAPAAPETAAELGIEPGEAVNYRVVELKDGLTGDTLIYAVSFTPLRRLAPGFRDDLLRADIPIGRILRKHRIESRREITDARTIPADPQLGRTFNIHLQQALLSRKYRIIHNRQPLIAIEEIFPSTAFSEGKRVLVNAPSRIHITLLDMNGSLGRVDGGIGIALDHPATILDARGSSELAVYGGDDDTRHRVGEAARATRGHFSLPGGAEITVHDTARQHVGLGSGTALALGAGTALCRLYDREAAARDLAKVVGRGGTSGIGTAVFEQGGFVLDGGHRFGQPGGKVDFRPSAASRGVEPPPVIARHPFPEDWQILLVTPNGGAGVHGTTELDLFRTHCPVPLGEVRELCHEVLMRLIPGLIEHDLDAFGTAVNRIQHLGFKKVELTVQPPVVPSLLEALTDAGAAGAGLSSFGPTVYAIGDSGMDDVIRAARDVLGDPGGSIVLTKARNTGADVTVI